MADHFEPEQLWLPRFEAASKSTDGLFFAIFPDHAAARRIGQVAWHLRNKHCLQCEPLQTKRFHVSLYRLGDYFGLPQDVVAQAKEAASSIAAQSFELGFNRAANFSGRCVDPERRRTHPHVLHADDGVPGIIALQRALASAIVQAGLSEKARMNYTPHLTLLYGERRIPEDFIETIRWSVREFVLVHSLLGKTQHVLLARWALSGRYQVRSASLPLEKTISVAG